MTHVELSAFIKRFNVDHALTSIFVVTDDYILRLVFTSDGVRVGVVVGSHKRAYDLVKIENRSRKRSHKLDGIGVGRIKTFPFLPIPFTTPSLMVK